MAPWPGGWHSLFMLGNLGVRDFIILTRRNSFLIRRLYCCCWELLLPILPSCPFSLDIKDFIKDFSLEQKGFQFLCVVSACILVDICFYRSRCCLANKCTRSYWPKEKRYCIKANSVHVCLLDKTSTESIHVWLASTSKSASLLSGFERPWLVGCKWRKDYHWTGGCSLAVQSVCSEITRMRVPIPASI